MKKAAGAGTPDTAAAAAVNKCGLCCTRIENFSVIRNKRHILQNIDLHIHCGELTALIGPNGAGKSTLLKAILGEIPHSGKLSYLSEGGKASKQPLIGYVPQQLNYDSSSPVSVMDLLSAYSTTVPVWMYTPRRIRSHASEILERVQAAHLLDKRLGDLSGGELQRVLLALALDPVPELLLLDEPVSGIDRKGLDLFYGMVSRLRKDYDMTIILVTHDLDAISKYADRVILLNRVILCSGTASEVFGSSGFSDIFSPFPAVRGSVQQGGDAG